VIGPDSRKPSRKCCFTCADGVPRLFSNARPAPSVPLCRGRRRVGSTPSLRRVREGGRLSLTAPTDTLVTAVLSFHRRQPESSSMSDADSRLGTHRPSRHNVSPSVNGNCFLHRQGTGSPLSPCPSFGGEVLSSFGYLYLITILFSFSPRSSVVCFLYYFDQRSEPTPAFFRLDKLSSYRPSF